MKNGKMFALFGAVCVVATLVLIMLLVRKGATLVREGRQPTSGVTKITAEEAPRVQRMSKSPGGSRGTRTPVRRELTTEPIVMVSGKVLFEDRSPVTSATVELWQNGVTLAGAHRKKERIAVSAVNDEGGYSVSGADGTGLTVEVKGSANSIATVPASTVITTEPSTRRLTQDFILPMLYEVKGTVVDELNNPVTSATVSVQSVDDKTDGWHYGPQRATVSATSEFTLQSVAAGKATIGAGAPGFVPNVLPITVPTGNPLVIRLARGTAGLNGRLVMYPDEAPVAGAEVIVQPAGKAASLDIAAPSESAVTTDNTGSFTLQGLAPGQHAVAIKAADGSELISAPGEPTDAFSPQLVDNQTTAITLTVFPGYTATGIVYDKETSEPLSGVNVSLVSRITIEATGETDAAGRYTFHKIINKLTGIRPRVEGFLPSSEVRPDPSGTVMVAYPKTSDVAELDLPMVPVVRLSGRVENLDGLPVPDAKIAWRGSANYRSTVSTVTDSQGKFDFVLQPLQQGVLEVLAAGYAEYRSPNQITLAKSDVDYIVVVLDHGASVSGRVVDIEGEGIAGATLQLNGYPYHVGTGMLGGSRSLGKTDTTGSFQADSLKAGKIKIGAKADGFGPGVADLTVAEGDSKTGVEIQLNQELFVEGRVEDKNGKPVVGADIWPWYSNNLNDLLSRVTTGDNGNFKLGGLSEGKVRINILASNPHRSKEVDTNAGVNDLIIQLDGDTVTVSCTVIDGLTQQPLKNFEVDSGRSDVQLDMQNGKFIYELPLGGSDSKRITAKGYLTKSFAIIPPNDAKTYEQVLEMGTGSGVTGRVVSELSREPLPGITVTANQENVSSTSPESHSVSDSAGRFSLINVASGRVEVAALPAAPLARVSKVIEVQEGEIADIGDIVVSEAGSVSGRVLKRPSGEPYTEVMLIISNATGSFREMKQPDAEGMFDFKNMTPGKYEVSAGSETRSVEVKPGEVTELTFHLGTVGLTVTVTKSGKPVPAVVQVTNVQTGERSTGAEITGSEYGIRNLVAGDYQMEVSPIPANQAADHANYFLKHTETISLPDQPLVRKIVELP